MPASHPTRQALQLLAGVTLLLPAPGAAQQQTMSIVRLTDRAYGAIYSEMKRDPVQSNALIVIGDDGVLVVDAHYTPSAARATIKEIQRLTRRPVRYVVTTHWHDDHVFGNQEYARAYPGVHFVAQQHTRELLAQYGVPHRDQLIKAYESAPERIATRLQTGIDRDGKPLTAERRAELIAMRPVVTSYLKDFKSVQVVLPDLTFDRQLTLHLGSLEVQVLSFGAGNTPGDAVVFLPSEGVAAVGDLVVHPVPFIYGGYPASWVNVLDSVRALKPAIIVPGHGPVMRDFHYLDQVQALMHSMAVQAGSAHRRGLTLDATREAFDLSAYHDIFVDGHEDREGTFQSSILQSGIEAAYAEATPDSTTRSP